MQLDHLILPVNDLAASVDFYTRILGFTDVGPDGPFHAVRVDDFMLLLSPFGTDGGVHLAFVVEHDEFDAAFARIKDAGVPYGCPFDGVGNLAEPSTERSARGDGTSIYFNDPNAHLLELLYYDAA